MWKASTQESRVFLRGGGDLKKELVRHCPYGVEDPEATAPSEEEENPEIVLEGYEGALGIETVSMVKRCRLTSG